LPSSGIFFSGYCLQNPNLPPSTKEKDGPTRLTAPRHAESAVKSAHGKKGKGGAHKKLDAKSKKIHKAKASPRKAHTPTKSAEKHSPEKDKAHHEEAHSPSRSRSRSKSKAAKKGHAAGGKKAAGKAGAKHNAKSPMKRTKTMAAVIADTEANLGTDHAKHYGTTHGSDSEHSGHEEEKHHEEHAGSAKKKGMKRSGTMAAVIADTEHVMGKDHAKKHGVGKRASTKKAAGGRGRSKSKGKGKK